MLHIYGFFTGFDKGQVLSSFMLLFASLNTLGNAPVVMGIKKRLGTIHVAKVTVASGCMMIAFLLGGRLLLDLFCIDDASFAVAGGIVLLLVGLEMILGVAIFRLDTEDANGSSVAPLAFPIMAGAGTMATLVTLKMKYATINILLAIFGNLVLVYLMLRYVDWIERQLGSAVVGLSQKVTGLILMSIAVKLVRIHLFVAV